MQVELLYHTPDVERAIATAARLCYAPVGATELMETMSEEQIHRILNIVIKGGHHSTLEHASFTFAVDGVSRTLTHQLVRHRMASFNQQSQRYVKFDGGFEYIEPPEIAANEEAHKIFSDCMAQCSDAYIKIREIVDEKGDPIIKKEDARFVLPNAAETKIVITMNCRELYHFFELRCCNRAQWEIREMAHKMLELCKEVAPFVFMDAGAPCVHGSCHEGKMTCGHPYPKVKRD